MPIYTSLLTAGLLAASLAFTVPVNSQPLNHQNDTAVFSNPAPISYIYNDDGDYLHRGSGR